jgi:hypothetical protein
MNQTNTENQLNFVIFSPAFQAHVGGVIALHNLARIIDEAGFPCKIFDMNGLKIPNSIFEKYGTEADVNKNTVVVYPEVTVGNPLNAKYIVRWILCELGINCPHDIYKTWGEDDFVYHYSTYNPEKDVRHYNLLSPLYIIYLKKFSSKYLIEKNILFLTIHIPTLVQWQPYVDVFLSYYQWQELPKMNGLKPYLLQWF